MQERLERLITEQNNPRTRGFSSMSTVEMLETINREDHLVADAVQREIENIAKAVEVITERLRGGGRMLYFGAGTSGRLGILDACECNPTFGVSDTMVQGIIAGGYSAIHNASAGDEDSAENGEREIREHNIGKQDVVIGIAASGRTPYVLGVIRAANAVGAATIGICNNPDSALHRCADITIAPETGPETIQGSTRMKAGSAQKMVLNMISTTVMTKLGKVYQNYMVDVVASNEKLFDRAQRMVVEITGKSRETAASALAAANGEVKTAIVMLQLEIDAAEARERLRKAEGSLEETLKERLPCGI